MREYLELGPVPCDEECTQTGKSVGYEEKQNREMRAYKHQLERMFTDSTFGVKRFAHDFGTYGEVVVYYHPGQPDEESAYDVESKLPQRWDVEAVRELRGQEVCPYSRTGYTLRPSQKLKSGNVLHGCT